MNAIVPRATIEDVVRYRNQALALYEAAFDRIEEAHAALQAEGIFNRVWTADFLTLRPETTGLYDIVVMNPPFDRERDIDHVVHALRFLKPDGQIHAIMSAGTEFRETKKAVAFRKLVIDIMGGAMHDLPAGSFSEVGTYVNTLILRVRNDRQKMGRW